MNHKALLNFSHFNFVLDTFSPFTPYGKKVKANLPFITCEKTLHEINHQTQTAFNLIKANPAKVDKIIWHLKRIPYLPEFSDEALTSADLFVIKKFLLNCEATAKNLSSEEKSVFNFEFKLSNLLEKLDIDENKEESFYISDKYDEDLTSTRKQIAKIEAQIYDLKKQVLDEISVFSIDFYDLDFVLTDIKSADKLPSKLVYKEPFDGKRVLLKPIFPEEYFSLLTKRSKLIDVEKKIEAKITALLSLLIKDEQTELLSLAKAVENFDLALARALMAKSFNLVCPHIHKNQEIEITNGRFLPIEKECVINDLRYWELSSVFNKRISVLHGSNMCGKTVTLKTILFFQLLVQYGFFVPAEKYSAPIFDNIAVIGYDNENEQGLSAFGSEIVSLNRAINNHKQKSLIIFDEFARTTNSSDALALLSGLLNFLNKKNGFTVFLATHYDSLPTAENVLFYRMKGISWQGLDKDMEEIKPNNLEERLKCLHAHIQYEPEIELDKTKSKGEAIRIAEILGLNQAILSEITKE